MSGIYANIQGLVNNYNELEILANDEKPEFIILSETHTTENNEENEIGRLYTYSESLKFNKNGRSYNIFQKVLGFNEDVRAGC